MEGRTRLDVFREDDCGAEACQTVDVHGQLERGEVKACQQREDAIEAGELVEDEGERYQGCAGRERKCEEEALEA